MKSGEEKTSAYWTGKEKAMQNSLRDITSSGGTIETQRLAFINLSKAMIQTIKTFSITAEKVLYVQFCPMANADKGAYWISDETEIKNPYYGEAMLTCGSTVETIN